MEQLRTYDNHAQISRVDDGPKGVHDFIISTSQVARDGAIIEAKGWNFDNFRQNPVVLFQHDDFRAPPIGRVVPDSLRSRSGDLHARIEFDMEDPASALIEGKIARGYMNATSVRWLPTKTEIREVDGEDVLVFLQQELLEVSIVSVPADPGALIKRAADGTIVTACELLDECRGAGDGSNALAHDPDPADTGDRVFTTHLHALDEYMDPREFDRLDDHERELAERLHAQLGHVLTRSAQDDPEAPAPAFPPDLSELAHGIRDLSDQVRALAEREPPDVARIVDDALAARTGRAN